MMFTKFLCCFWVFSPSAPQWARCWFSSQLALEENCFWIVERSMVPHWSDQLFRLFSNSWGILTESCNSFNEFWSLIWKTCFEEILNYVEQVSRAGLSHLFRTHRSINLVSVILKHYDTSSVTLDSFIRAVLLFNNLATFLFVFDVQKLDNTERGDLQQLLYLNDYYIRYCSKLLCELKPAPYEFVFHFKVYGSCVNL